jgi:hypothetical protein
MRKLIGKYSGIVIGSVYGLTMRVFFFDTFHSEFGFTDLFSITFIWVVPALIGITPLLFATNSQLRSTLYRCFAPLFTILLFFTFCFITNIEDLICIIIIALPFMVAGMIAGYFFGKMIIRYRDRKGIVYSILLLPLLLGPIEEQLKIPSGTYEVQNTVIINNTSNNIWDNVVRVKDIRTNEYSKGFFNYAGIPRPLYAQLDKDQIGGERTGHFEGGLVFKETVNHWELNKKVSFNISVIDSSIRKTIFDQHILKGNHFKFIGACYQLNKINSKQTLLTLSSTYQLDTRINYYASFWGNLILSDFQQRLLNVIKKRCDE